MRILRGLTLISMAVTGCATKVATLDNSPLRSDPEVATIITTGGRSPNNYGIITRINGQQLRMDRNYQMEPGEVTVVAALMAPPDEVGRSISLGGYPKPREIRFHAEAGHRYFCHWPGALINREPVIRNGDSLRNVVPIEQRIFEE